MRISNISTVTANPTAVRKQNNENPNFQARLILSREASKTLAEKARNFGREVNNGVADFYADLAGMDFAAYIDKNINYLAELIKPVVPEDFPVVFDLSSEYKDFLNKGGTLKDFEKDLDLYIYGGKPMFELCPNGTHLKGLEYRMAFNLQFNILQQQMERLGYAIKERVEYLFKKYPLE